MSELEKRDDSLDTQESVSSEKSKKKDKTPAKKKEKKPNRVLRWFKDLKGELKKVTWPSAKDTLKNVGIVIACVIVVGVFVWVFDLIVRQVVNALFSLLG